ncbi:EamA family transporter RarD [Catenuloplanes indicus]|uniref:Chloramphenicol-sensitive protein RarD n=1 Tax=Catenuloplanes indicus TaxID=137267 RepID=A0AAE3W2V1_9ACTN|nr:EamA family transporter RarD [Catenuloplanes indicus]MDQ0367390.1 chloramphenicol-sensitive protein RarD [Catenuloplanes indicus]
MDETRRGLAYGLTAYAIWGFFPLYIRLLEPAGPVEILAHRVVWSVVFVAALLTLLRGWSFLRSLRGQPKRLGGIALAAVLIGINWGGYIYGVHTERVVETALGYFITPLVVVLLGVLVLRERLRPAQWAALGVSALAVLVLTVDYGRLPYIALTLAASFGTYGLVKKNLALPPSGGLFVESAVLALPALAYLAWLTATGGSTFGTEGAGHLALMVLSGAATAIPLIMFAGAANRLTLTAVGILQYVAPVLQLVVAVFIFHEPMPPARLAGFALVWVALIIFTVDGIRSSRAARKAAVATAA